MGHKGKQYIKLMNINQISINFNILNKINALYLKIFFDK